MFAPTSPDQRTQGEAPSSAGVPLSRAAALVRLLVLSGGLGLVAVASVRSGLDAATVRELVSGAGWIGPAVYVVAYATLTVALVPGALLTASGGVLFGIATGSLLTLLGATLGAVAAFLVARGSGRQAVDRLVAGRVARVDRWLGDRGFVAVLTLRLVPLVPFNAANYAAGVTAIRLRDFAGGTAVGIVPGVVVYTTLGARASDPTGPVFLLAAAGLLVLAVVGVLVVRRPGAGSAHHQDSDPVDPHHTTVDGRP